MVTEITSQNELEAILAGSSTAPVLVDVYATWCRPCKNLAPIIEKVAEETDGRLTVAKIDLEEFVDFAEGYGIQSVPTLLVFNNGKVSARASGLQPKDQIMALVGLGSDT